MIFVDLCANIEQFMNKYDLKVYGGGGVDWNVNVVNKCYIISLMSHYKQTNKQTIEREIRSLTCSFEVNCQCDNYTHESLHHCCVISKEKV